MILMALNMIFKVTFCNESLVAPFTIILALIGMASQMDLQVTFLGKAFGADIADERFKSLMFSQVYQQT